MHIIKRVIGAALTLFAVVILAIGFGSGGYNSVSQSVLDSSETSGRLLGIMIPVMLFGVLGIWLVFATQQTK
ncbi:hypothetical protein NHH03_03315 [Stieleria sp. TO1_6]|uniref:hypothetical protein n=1 Tax=Stieleria tagensis TaxID=2956795 RepID=UPI00209A6FD3|nr:hypothetical protein [Stieleria tagensis]MCO8120753.1 hypothetical protein [Stieleria tagensis]